MFYPVFRGRGRKNLWTCDFCILLPPPPPLSVINDQSPIIIHVAIKHLVFQYSCYVHSVLVFSFQYSFILYLPYKHVFFIRKEKKQYGRVPFFGINENYGQNKNVDAYWRKNLILPQCSIGTFYHYANQLTLKAVLFEYLMV